MGIADEDIDKVRMATNLADLVGETVALRRSGTRWVGLCPFHTEKTPSFSVNAEIGYFKCLAAETPVITWDGVRPIGELAGTTQRVLTERGRWVDAPFRSFGVQPLVRVLLSRDRVKKELFATPEHRWFIRMRGGARHERTTGELRAGDRLSWSFPQRAAGHRDRPSSFGIAHGVVHAAGALLGHGSSVRLVGRRNEQLLKWFPLSPTAQYADGIGVFDLPAHFTSRPALDESRSYLLGWLAGYFAADGHVADDGTPTLHSARRDDLEFVRLICQRLGIGVYGITTQMRVGIDQGAPTALHRIHFIQDDLDEDFFLIDQHRLNFVGHEKRWSQRGWVVEAVEPTDRVEEVFCATVPGTHSFTLEDNILTGNCFGCGVGGDAITFVRETRHLDFVGAVEDLARRLGVTLRYDSPRESGQRSRRSRLVEVMERAVEWYHQRLLTGPDARSARGYLRSRGYDGDLVRRYRLGWAPDAWDALATGLGAPADQLDEVGLAFTNRVGRLQDSFRARVLFPIFDARGDPLAFGGRVLPGDEVGPKYKNSSATALYDKSETLYGLNWAKAEVVAADEVVVCEGYTDVLGMATAGIGRAVATCGTALTERHATLLRGFARRIVLAFDADAAGQGAAARFYEWEAKFGLEVAVAALPPGADPGALAQEDPAALRAAVEGAVPFLAFRLRRLLEAADLTSAEGRARAAEAALGAVAEHPSELVRDQYLMEVADRTRLDPERLRPVLARGPRPAPEVRGRPDGPPSERPPASRRRAPSPGTAALRLAVHRPAQVAPLLDEALFLDEVDRAAYLALAGAATFPEAVADAPPEAAELLERLAVEELEAEDPEDVVGRLADRAATALVRDLLAEARTSDDPLRLSPTIAWLKDRVADLRDPTVRSAALAQLVPFLAGRRAPEEGP